MPTLPTNPHDWALWLHESLDSVSHVGDGMWEGQLPLEHDWQEIVDAVDVQPRSLGGVHDEASRTIAFYPASACVYESTGQLLGSAYNLVRVPSRFTVRDIGYTHGNTLPVPDRIDHYVSAVKLVELLTKMADHAGGTNGPLHFIKSHDEKLEVQLEYGECDLMALPSLEQLENMYVATNHHADQKRNIVRNSLLSVFKGKRCIKLSELLPRFEEFMENVRASYSMYIAEFSFEKVRAEVEKDNLDSTLKLNKTFSDVQNQLLAIPVALILVGGQMTPSAGLVLKNVVVWFGSALFSALMWMLIYNQRNAVKAIGHEISLRWEKIEQQPVDISSKFKKGFDELSCRQKQQDYLLRVLTWVVGVSLLFSTLVLLWYSYQESITELFTWGSSKILQLIRPTQGKN